MAADTIREIGVPRMSTRCAKTAPRVLIVDDQPEFREFARELLDGDIWLEVIGEAPEANTAFALVEDLMPDVVLMDLDMPKMNGLEAIERIRDEFPTVLTVLTGIHDEWEYRALALVAGAIDFINKRDLSPQRVTEALAKAS
jgi:DNA-binding NarL/FixJ family response regulator